MPRKKAPHRSPQRETIRKDRPLTRADVRDPYTVAELYRIHHDDLYSMALNRLHSPDLAEDTVQQAFANTISAVEEGVRVDHSGRWLNRCVQNVCVDMLRVAPDAPLDEAHDLTQSLSLTESAELRERCRSIDSAVNQLPAHLRAVFLLAEVRGLGYTEIADQMHRSVDSVRQLIFRARQHVRDLVGHENALMAGPLLRLNAHLSAPENSKGESLRRWLSLKLDALHASFASLPDRIAQIAHQPALAILAACVVLVSVPIVVPTDLDPDSRAPAPLAVNREASDVSPSAARDRSERRRARSDESSQPRTVVLPEGSNRGDSAPPNSSPTDRDEGDTDEDSGERRDQPTDDGDRNQESGEESSDADPGSSVETGYTPMDPPDDGVETGTSPMDDDSTETSIQPIQKVRVAPIPDIPAVKTEIAPYTNPGGEEGPISNTPNINMPALPVSSIPMAPVTQQALPAEQTVTPTGVQN